MKPERIKLVREKMESAADYPHDWDLGRVTIKTMAKYLEAVYPELVVRLEDWTTTKDTTYARSRIRSPGIRDYTGYKLKVWYNAEDWKENWRYGTLIDHNTTETYRKNYEVAEKIIDFERLKRFTGESRPICPKCSHTDVYVTDDKKFFCRGCNYKTTEWGKTLSTKEKTVEVKVVKIMEEESVTKNDAEIRVKTISASLHVLRTYHDWTQMELQSVVLQLIDKEIRGEDVCFIIDEKGKLVFKNENITSGEI